MSGLCRKLTFSVVEGVHGNKGEASADNYLLWQSLFPASPDGDRGE